MTRAGSSHAEVLAAWAERDALEQMYMLAGFWVEAVIYGIYLVLFLGALNLMVRKPSEHRFSTKMVFLFLTSAMFILTSFYTGVNIYRFIRAYALRMAPGKIPIYYFRDFSTWDNFVYAIVSSTLFWIADALVIYRCFVIWGRSYPIIAIPSILLVVSIATNGVNLYWFLHPTKLPFRTIKPLLDFVYPGHLAQNVFTTGLIAYKIWKQHLTSRASGILVLSSVTLFSIARIIVESAMVYTLQMLTLVVLYFMNHPAQVILQAAIVPSTGIVFVLISIRLHMATLESARIPQPSSLILPSWIHTLDREMESRRQSTLSILPVSIKRDTRVPPAFNL